VIPGDGQKKIQEKGIFRIRAGGDYVYAIEGEGSLTFGHSKFVLEKVVNALLKRHKHLLNKKNTNYRATLVGFPLQGSVHTEQNGPVRLQRNWASFRDEGKFEWKNALDASLRKAAVKTIAKTSRKTGAAEPNENLPGESPNAADDNRTTANGDAEIGHLVTELTRLLRKRIPGKDRGGGAHGGPGKKGSSRKDQG